MPGNAGTSAAFLAALSQRAPRRNEKPARAAYGAGLPSKLREPRAGS